MRLTLDDLEQAADLIVRNRETWEGWLSRRPLDNQLGPGGAYGLARIENVSSGNQMEIVAIWQHHHPLPDIRCWFSEKPGAGTLVLNSPSMTSPLESRDSAGFFPRDWRKEKAWAEEYRRQVAACLTPELLSRRVWRKDKAKAEEYRRQEQAAFYFHLFLSGNQTPASLKKKHSSLPKCRGCPAMFQEKTPQQLYGERLDESFGGSEATQRLYCCLPCQRGRKLRGRHGLWCTRLAPQKHRRLRKILANATTRPHIPPTANLIACAESKENIFLQLVAYARRAGHLSPGVEDEAYSRFVALFKPNIGKLSEARHQGQKRKDVYQDIINDAWIQVRKNYRLPTDPDGFSRFVRSTIRQLKHPSNFGDTVSCDDEDSISKAVPPVFPPSPQEAARMAGVSQSTFYHLMEKGVIPFKQDGRKKELTADWQSAVTRWKKQERKHLRQSVLRKLYALAWEKRQGLRRSSAAPEISPSAITQVKRWCAAGMTEDEIKQKIGVESLKQAIKEVGQYLTEQELEVL